MKTTIYFLVVSAGLPSVTSAFASAPKVGLEIVQRNGSLALYSKQQDDDTNVNNRRAFISSSVVMTSLVAPSFLSLLGKGSPSFLVAHAEEETVDDLAMPSAEEKKISVSVAKM